MPADREQAEECIKIYRNVREVLPPAVSAKLYFDHVPEQDHILITIGTQYNIFDDPQDIFPRALAYIINQIEARPGLMKEYKGMGQNDS